MTLFEKLTCAAIVIVIVYFLSQISSSSSSSHSASQKHVSPPPPRLPLIEKVKVLETIPHDNSVFVQGLEFHQGLLYETGGLYGQSLLRKLNVSSGKELKRISFGNAFFAEGLTIFQDTVYVLTWREHTVFQYDLEFQPLRQFSISTEGWGLTHNEHHLIYSDGSDRLFYVSPSTFQVERTLKVVERTQSGPDRSVSRLNELEYVNGLIYANVWLTSDIVLIDPQSGYVVKRIQCNSLTSKASKLGADVLNGIAFNSDQNALYVTGKLWSTLHRIQS